MFMIISFCCIHVTGTGVEIVFFYVSNKKKQFPMQQLHLLVKTTAYKLMWGETRRTNVVTEINE